MYNSLNDNFTSIDELSAFSVGNSTPVYYYLT